MTQQNIKMIAKTLFGMEGILLQELQELGAENLEVLNRAVSFTGNLEMLYRANYHLRTAIRVITPIRQFKAINEQALYKGIQSINWDEYLGYKNTLAIDSTVQSDTFQHSLFVSQKCKDAIVDQFRDKYGVRPDVDTKRPDLRVNVHIRGQDVNVSLDSSGESLHLRGYRKSLTEAPLSEVLAAGMILLSGWDRNSNFVDFMCGSGTLLTEAGLMACNIAPGKFRRHFGFQSWKNYDADLLEAIRKEASEKEKHTLDFRICGCDYSPGAIRTASGNIQGAGLEDKIEVEISDFTKYVPPAGDGMLMVNPPYGERLKPDDLANLYKKIGDTLKSQYAGYTAWILTSSEEGFKSVGLRPSRKITLQNGPLECKFLKYELYRGSKKAKYNQLQ